MTLGHRQGARRPFTGIKWEERKAGSTQNCFQDLPMSPQRMAYQLEQATLLLGHVECRLLETVYWVCELVDKPYLCTF